MAFSFISETAAGSGSLSSMLMIGLFMQALTVVAVGSSPRATPFRLRSVSVMIPT